MTKTISKGGKEELALALLLWKDFKSQGVANLEIYKQALELAEWAGVRTEFEAILTRLPPLEIKPRKF